MSSTSTRLTTTLLASACNRTLANADWAVRRKATSMLGGQHRYRLVDVEVGVDAGFGVQPFEHAGSTPTSRSQCVVLQLRRCQRRDDPADVGEAVARERFYLSERATGGTVVGLLSGRTCQ